MFLSVLPTSHLGAFMATVCALILLPGPSVLFVVSRGIVLGRRAAVATVVGNASGLAVQLVLVSLGAGALISRSKVALTTLSWVGAAYLVFLGAQTIRDRGTSGLPTDVGAVGQSTATTLRQGFIVGATNPKGFVIFAAVVPQFIDRSAGGVSSQLLALGIICVCIALVCDSAWALAAASAGRWFAASSGRLKRLRIVGGLVLVTLGIALAVTATADVA
jgi:threonine/homoserine/homoserine lactone efflux protein